MKEIGDCGFMELWCLQHAKADPRNTLKWHAQAERWRNLSHTRIAAEFQKPRQMTAGPMEMGPNPISGGRQQQS
jgi:hypothetical protein